MSIEKMSLVNIAGSLKSLDAALLRCCESELFHVEFASTGPKSSGFHPINEENPYNIPLQTVIDVMNLLSVPLAYEDYDALGLSEEEMIDYAKQLKESCLSLKAKQNQLQKDLSLHKQTAIQLEHLKGLDIPFDDILSSKNYTARFGRLPVDSFIKLSYFSKKNFLFFDFDHDDNYFWGVYFAPNTHIEEIDDMFNSLYFEPIDIPSDVHDTPELAAENLDALIGQEEEALVLAEAEFEKYKRNNIHKLQQIYSVLKIRNDTFSYRKYATVADKQFFLEGFVPTRKVETFFKLFNDLENVICEEQPPDADIRLTPPVKLHTNWFFKPFEMFIKMYGLPGYNDFNPTSFIGFIYVLLFGIMFGDLGQGFLLAAGGFALWKWKKVELAAIVSRCGISSMIFGCIYGSVFGFEHALDPLFKLFGFAEKPIDVLHPETTNMLLLSVIGIGIVIIICSILLNIYLGLKKKDYERAVFSNNGIAGLIFYGGVVLAAVLLMISGINVLNPVFIIFVVILPLLLMLLKEPLGKLAAKKKDIKPESGIGSFIMQNLFELFEFLLSYISNTLSFLRVGGFVLSHAGLMTVVMTLSEMVGDVGSPIVVIIGNIVVMGLEGLLVGIQVLRLVFYETFSRFYEGDGKPFVPAKVDFSNQDLK